MRAWRVRRPFAIAFIGIPLLFLRTPPKPKFDVNQRPGEPVLWLRGLEFRLVGLRVWGFPESLALNLEPYTPNQCKPKTNQQRDTLNQGPKALDPKP